MVSDQLVVLLCSKSVVIGHGIFYSIHTHIAKQVDVAVLPPCLTVINKLVTFYEMVNEVFKQQLKRNGGGGSLKSKG